MGRLRDLLRADKGRGRLSSTADREVREQMDANHPRQEVGPLTELEVMDEKCALAAGDEMKTMFDRSCHPKPPSPREEGVTSRDGRRTVDLGFDTPPVEREFGLLPADPGEGFDLMALTPNVEDDLGIK